jgi:hypothetical protein
MNSDPTKRMFEEVTTLHVCNNRVFGPYTEQVERSREHFLDQIQFFSEDKLRDMVYQMAHHITSVQTRIGIWAQTRPPLDDEETAARVVRCFAADYLHTLQPGSQYEEYMQDKSED